MSEAENKVGLTESKQQLKKVFVVGSTGRVGTNVCKQLLKTGEYEVYGATRTGIYAFLP